MELTVHRAETTGQLDMVRQLLKEYWAQFGFTPCFQGFADEVAQLPGAYAPPDGLLAFATAGVDAAGCIAFRPVDLNRCEMKRLYVRPDFRGYGVGRVLIDKAVQEARAAGYREIVADTLPVMHTALALYERYGFERTEPYSPDPTPDAIFIRLRI
jgi:ribosomal protein S18 acetylase RimI-like enzyme